MEYPLHGRNFLTLLDYTPQENSLSAGFGKAAQAAENSCVCRIACSKAETLHCCLKRLRPAPVVPFEAAGMDLGMGVTFLDSRSVPKWAKKESIPGRYGESTRTLCTTVSNTVGFTQQSVVQDLAQVFRRTGLERTNGYRFTRHRFWLTCMTIEEAL